jgi:predicted MFS family arabinose efflux permease
MQKTFAIGDAQTGLLASLFMISYVITSPLSAQLSNSFPPLKVIALGLGGWVIAVVVTGIAPNYAVLAVARAFSGVGEASFLCITPVGIC